MSLLDRLPPGLRKLVLYALCGGSGVALDLLVYSLLVLSLIHISEPTRPY